MKHASLVSGIVLLFVAAGCDKGHGAESSTDASPAPSAVVATPLVTPSSSATASAAASTRDGGATTLTANAPAVAPTVSGSVIVDLVKVKPDTKKLDTTDWKAAVPSPLHMKWTIDQSKARPPVVGDARDDLTKHKVPVDLALTVGGHTHSVTLEGNAGVASASLPGAVSMFFAGLSVSFRVQRTEGDRAVITRTVTSESAPTTETQLFVFDLPNRATFTQEVVVIDKDGKRTSVPTGK